MKVVRYFVEVGLEHTEGPIAADLDLKKLGAELLTSAIERGDVVTTGTDSFYQIALSKVRYVGPADARQFIGVNGGPRDNTSTPAPAPLRKAMTEIEYRFGDVLDAYTNLGTGPNVDKDKRRPVVYITTDPETGLHLITGITSQRTYQNGSARQPLSWKGGIYLDDSYLWGGAFRTVKDEDIVRVLGHLPDNDVRSVVRMYRKELAQHGVDPWLTHVKVAT